MTIASHGYDGTLDEHDFAELMELVGRPPVVAGPTDLLVEPVAGARAVTSRAGTAYAVGVQVDVDEEGGPNRITIPTPTNGQFFLVALRRDWGANNSDPDAGELVDGSSFQLISSDTTSNVEPTVPPTVLPALAGEPGVQFDQVLAWVWATSASTAVKVWDLRAQPDDLERVRTIAARDAIPAERLYAGKRVLVESDGTIYRRALTTWNREGVNPVDGAQRPSEPYLNMLIFETNTKRFGYWDGGAWVFPTRDAGSLDSGTVPFERLPSSVQRAANEAGVDEGRLGRSTKNVSNQDMNGITETGFYRGNAMGNAPTGDWLHFIVQRHDDGYVKQVAFHFFGSGMWTRRKDGGNWSGWDQHPTVADVQNGTADNRYFPRWETYNRGEVDQRIYDNARRTADDAWNKANDAQNNRTTWNQVQDAINGRGLQAIASGALQINGGSSVGIGFPGGRFNNTPRMATGIFTGSSVRQHVGFSNVSAGGCTLYYYRDASTAAAEIDWIATQTY